MLSSRLESSSDGECYRPVIEYAYVVAGRRYTSDHLDLLDAYQCYRPDAEAILARYPVGARVQAYADPDDPRDVVLERWPADVPLVAIMSAATIVLGTALLVLGLVRRRRARRSQL